MPALDDSYVRTMQIVKPAEMRPVFFDQLGSVQTIKTGPMQPDKDYGSNTRAVNCYSREEMSQSRPQPYSSERQILNAIMASSSAMRNPKEKILSVDLPVRRPQPKTIDNGVLG